MSIFNFYKRIRWCIRDITINRKNRKRLTNTSFSMICNDCLAGCICKDLKVRMNSPTRNFYFNADDYIKFCKNLKYYLSLTPKEYDGDYSEYGNQYLMAALDDIKLFLVHYKSVDDFIVEWNRRVDRIDWDNIFFVMNDRNMCEDNDIREFCSLPYKNKVFLSHIPLDYDCVFYVKGSENDPYVKSLTNYYPKWWIKRYYDQFDWVNWLNNGL